MRTVIIRSNPVAPDPRVEKTANSLKKHGHDVHVLAWDRSSRYSEKNTILHLTDFDVSITRFGIPGIFGGGIKKNLFSLLKFQRKIFYWLFKKRNFYDAIHAYDFDTGYTALMCAKLFNKKLVYDIADYYIDSHYLRGTKLGSFLQKAENNLINRSDAVIICTEKRKQQIAGTQPRNLTVIHNSPSVIAKSGESTIKAFKGRPDRLKIVYVGMLAEGRFIREIAEIVMKRNDLEFHVGGFGKLEDYFKVLSESYDNIYYYGRIPYNETLELENKCDVIAGIYDPKIPNHYYAAPNKFYEALMQGKPIIMARNTGMDDVVEKNGIGVVIDFEKSSLEKAINHLINRKAEWPIISEIAGNIYKTEYSWNIMENRIVKLYNYL